MKNNTPTMIILSIFAVIGGIALNFQEFLMGNSATIKNAIVTFAYVEIWILVLIISIKNKNRGIMKYCFIFWIITLSISILMGYVNLTGAQVDWALPIAISLLGQWYGINFFVVNFLTASVIMAVISLAMVIVAGISIKRTK